jgi:hypothetical protein
VAVAVAGCGSNHCLPTLFFIFFDCCLLKKNSRKNALKKSHNFFFFLANFLKNSQNLAIFGKITVKIQKNAQKNPIFFPKNHKKKKKPGCAHVGFAKPVRKSDRFGDDVSAPNTVFSAESGVFDAFFGVFWGFLG